jgi:peroxiredoxin
MKSIPRNSRFCTAALFFFVASALGFAAGFLLPLPSVLWAQKQKIQWSEQEKPIIAQINTLRSLPDDVRAGVTRSLALQIRKLPATANKVRLANGLAGLSTEGDFGHETLQEVATTLAAALKEQPTEGKPGEVPSPYIELAEMARYEHVDVKLDDPQFAAANAKLDADNERREKADFTLAEPDGKAWSLKEQRGKVVVVNFWATWCPPCRKEMPDLDSLYQQFKDQGLVILAISDEPAGTVKPFVVQERVTYPILLDPEGKVHQQFQVGGIPKTFVYDRTGKLVAQSIDMRTKRQFLEMLAQAGLK